MQATVHGKTRRFRTVTFGAPAYQLHRIDQQRLLSEFKNVAIQNFFAPAATIRDRAGRGAGALAATTAAGPVRPVTTIKAATVMLRPGGQPHQRCVPACIRRASGGMDHRHHHPGRNLRTR